MTALVQMARLRQAKASRQHRIPERRRSLALDSEASHRELILANTAK